MVSVMQTVDTGHEDMLHDAQLDYYGTRLATCSSDKSVKVFEVRNKQQVLLADLREHEGPVWQVAWSHPAHGSLLASCGYDRRVLVWQEQRAGQWRKLYEYGACDSSVNSIAWAPHEFGAILACCSSDGSITVLTAPAEGAAGGAAWAEVKIPNAHQIGANAVSWAPAVTPDSLLNPDGAAPAAKRLVSGGCDSAVRVWREKPDGEWEEEARLEGHSDWVRDVAWAPSVGLARQLIASCGQDRNVILWSRDANSGPWQQTKLHTFDDVVWHVSWSVTGNILAASGGDNRVSLWKEALDGQWLCLSDMQGGGGGGGGGGAGEGSLLLDQ